MQDFHDFEIVVIDDCSTDYTPEVVATFKDPRIRYIRNEVNVGAKLGDREHVRRFVYEVMRGRYFVYLCDDDYWLLPDLLTRQMEIFRAHDNVSFVMGNQLSYFLTTPDSYFGHSEDDTIAFTLDNIGPYFNLSSLACKTHHFSFFPQLFSRAFLTSDQFLREFAAEPPTKNRIVGATLYSRDHFLLAGAMKTEGSKWQAGYEFLMGPACVGNVGYIDAPCIVTEIRAANASFQRTQVEHYLDSIKSVEIAFRTPLESPSLAPRRRFLRKMKAEAIRNLSRAFLANTMAILRDGTLSLCSDENMGEPVTLKHLMHVAIRNRIFPGVVPLKLGAMIEVERRTGGYFLRWSDAHRNTPRGKRLVTLLNDLGWLAVQSIWSRVPQAGKNLIRPWINRIRNSNRVPSNVDPAPKI